MMIADLLKLKERVTHSRPYFVLFKLPMILFAALFGFIMEFVVELPLMVLCLMDRRFKNIEKTEVRRQKTGVRRQESGTRDQQPTSNLNNPLIGDKPVVNCKCIKSVKSVSKEVT